MALPYADGQKPYTAGQKPYTAGLCSEPQWGLCSELRQSSGGTLKHKERKKSKIMWTSFFVLFFSLIYMELIYHFFSFGFSFLNPLMMLPLCLFLAGLETYLVSIWKRRINRNITWVILSVEYIWFAAQFVYMHIFRQPLLFAAAATGGKDALTNYWREALVGIGQSAIGLLLMAVPFFVTGWLMWMGYLYQKSVPMKKRLLTLAASGSGLVLYFLIIVIGKVADTSYFNEYSEYYDPKNVIESMGVLVSMQRDFTGSMLPANNEFIMPDDVPVLSNSVSGSDLEDVSGSDIEDGENENQDGISLTAKVGYNWLPIDFATLNELSDTKELQKLTQYMAASKGTKKNEYTGMFEGYNLIFLTAEGFCPYAVDENLTPTLYKMIHSGFVFNDYYVPLWYTSTSDGEYTNLTGLIPDQQMFSMRRSSDIEMPYTIAKYFLADGATATAYHNNTLSYYDRNRSHPNLGYEWRASKLGDLSEAEWGSHVFEMEGAGEWPASDYNMMVATMPEYINDDYFHVYYMTVSGHMNYNFAGNKMSSKNKDLVADLPYNEEGRAYIACNIELDKALQYMIEELEKAGKLENTVICLSADHYPYAMEPGTLDELAGRKLENLEMYQNNLILWNSEMETVEVNKPCSSIDLLPTLLNLFGFEYDSRLYAGRDIFSDCEPLVIFSDRSFITDKVIYVKKTKEVIPRTDEAVTEEYVDSMKNEVKNRYNYSSGILNNNFYKYVQEALKEAE